LASPFLIAKSQSKFQSKVEKTILNVSRVRRQGKTESTSVEQNETAASPFILFLYRYGRLLTFYLFTLAVSPCLCPSHLICNQLEKVFDMNNERVDGIEDIENEGEGDDLDDDQDNAGLLNGDKEEKKIKILRLKGRNSTNSFVSSSLSHFFLAKTFNSVTANHIALAAFSLLLRMLRYVPTPILPFDKFAYVLTARQWEV
jgi:hypothetical protein